VTSAGDRYAIPQLSLLELIRLEGEQARKGLEMINGAPVYRLRGKLLPIVYLKRELKAESHVPGSDNPDAQSVKIVVLRADDRPFGLVVDEINDTEEIAVKPLSKQLKTINTYADFSLHILEVCRAIAGELCQRCSQRGSLPRQLLFKLFLRLGFPFAQPTAVRLRLAKGSLGCLRSSGRVK